MINQNMFKRLLLTALVALLVTGCNDEAETSPQEALTATGTSLAGARVVRTAVLETTGAMVGKFTAPAEDSTFLRGNCAPTMWANFGIQFDHPGYAWIAVTMMSKKPIATGQTGDIPLDWLDVSLLAHDIETNDINSLFFKGPGTLEITRHDSTPDARRMSGVMTATGLTGSLDAEGQTLDVRFAFDVDFSCGVS